MCRASQPCGGAIVEDDEFFRRTGRRMVRCFGSGHTLYVDAAPIERPTQELFV